MAQKLMNKMAQDNEPENYYISMLCFYLIFEVTLTPATMCSVLLPLLRNMYMMCHTRCCFCGHALIRRTASFCTARVTTWLRTNYTLSFCLDSANELLATVFLDLAAPRQSVQT